MKCINHTEILSLWYMYDFFLDFRKKKDSKRNGFIYFVAINGLSGNNNVSLGRYLIGVKIKMKISSYHCQSLCWYYGKPVVMWLLWNLRTFIPKVERTIFRLEKKQTFRIVIFVHSSLLFLWQIGFWEPPNSLTMQLIHRNKTRNPGLATYKVVVVLVSKTSPLPSAS